MNPIIMMVMAVLLLIGAVVRSIDWRGHAVKWVGNNPDHAQLYIKAGDTVKTISGERDKDNILMYNYQIGKRKLTVTLAANYPYEYIRGRRIIGLEDGKAIVSPLGFMSQEDLKKYRESSIEISVLAQSQAVVKALQSISQSKPINWMTIIIIGVIVIVGLYWYSNQNKPEKGINTSNQTAIQTSNNTVPGVPGLILIPVEKVKP